MNKLLNIPETDRFINNLENHADRTVFAISNAIRCVNDGFNQLWSLQDSELVAVAQALHNQGSLDKLTSAHATVASALNKIHVTLGMNTPKALTESDRSIVVEEGVVSVVRPVEETDEEEPVDEEETLEDETSEEEAFVVELAE